MRKSNKGEQKKSLMGPIGVPRSPLRWEYPLKKSPGNVSEVIVAVFQPILTITIRVNQDARKLSRLL